LDVDALERAQDCNEDGVEVSEVGERSEACRRAEMPSHMQFAWRHEIAQIRTAY